MAGKKHYKQINIDVEPFLSIMAIVLKLVSLILVVIVMRIAVNAGGKKIVTLTKFSSSHGINANEAKEPSYIDCYADSVVLYPSMITNTWEDLQRPDNAVEQLLDQVQVSNKTQYVIIMARPDAVKIFRSVRKMISNHTVDVGYDVVDADFKVNWDAAVKALAVSQ